MWCINKGALLTTLPYFIPTILLMSCSLVLARLSSSSRHLPHVLLVDSSKSTVWSAIHSRSGMVYRTRPNVDLPKDTLDIGSVMCQLNPCQGTVQLTMTNIIHKIAGSTNAATNVITSATTRMTVAATRFSLKADSI
jgi:hypothetical protein